MKLLKEDSDAILLETGDDLLHEGVMYLVADLSGTGTLAIDLWTYFHLLEIEQKKPVYHGLVKIVLTKSGEDTLTYTNEDRLLDIQHIESDNSYKAEVVLSNHDNTFSSLDLTGYTAVVSWGMRLAVGDAYRPTAPLRIIHQQNVSAQGVLRCNLWCVSILDRMGEHISEYLGGAPDISATDTLKDIITGVLTPSATYGYTNYEAVGATWDSEDTLIDTYVLGDYWTVQRGASRLGKLNGLLMYSKEVKRLHRDGNVHFLNPTVSGTTYAYEYELLGDHTFLSKASAYAPIVPNSFAVQDLAGLPEGDAKDDDSWAIRPVYVAVKLPNTTAIGDTIAAAFLQKATLNSQSLNMGVPMNVLQAVWDYIKVTDSREGGTTKTGNVQYIKRYWYATTGQFGMQIKLGGNVATPGSSSVSIKGNIMDEDAEERNTSVRLATLYSILTGALEMYHGEFTLLNSQRINALEKRLQQTKLKVDYEAGDLDTEAEVIVAINATNTKINSTLQEQEAEQ